MAKLYLLLLLLMPFISAAQDKPFNYKDVEARVKKHINSNPDSTRAIIDEALRYKNLNDTIKANLYNIYGIYYGTVGKVDSAIVYYKRALGLFKCYPKMMARPLMNIANSYRNKGEFNESFKYLDQALDLSKDYKLHAYEGTIYGNYASNYQYMQQYDKAVEYNLKSIAILKQEKEPGQLLSSQQKLANTYLKMQNFEFAKDMYKECLTGFKQQKDNNNYSLTLVNYAECLNQLGQYSAALKALEEAISGLKKINNPQHLGIAYSKIGNIALKQHDYSKATSNYEKSFKVLCTSKSLHTTLIAAEYVELLNKIKNYSRALEVIETLKALAIYDNAPVGDKLKLDIALAETYSKTNEDNMAIAGLQRAIKLKDSLSKVNTNQRTRDVQAKFQNVVQREKKRALEANNKLLKQDANESRIRVIIYVGAVVAIILLILLILRGSWLKNRLQKELLLIAGAEVELLHKQHLHEQQLTNAQREMIEEKQRELTSTALRMASYQDSISGIIQNCDARSIIKVADFKKELLQLEKQQDYWRQFETRFNSLHPDFGANLQNRYTKLTKNDIEFCSLLKLNLSNKEIASLLQISHESAITKKYRIKKKMEISDDTEFEKLLLAI